MKKLKLVVTICVCSFINHAQVARYLEKIGYEEATYTDIIAPSVASDNSRLAVSNFRFEKSNDYLKFKFITSGRLINLKTGKFEMNTKDSYSFINDQLLVADYTAGAGKLLDPKTMVQEAFKYIDYYFQNLETNEKQHLPKLPDNYALSDTYAGKYLLLKDYINGTSAWAEVLEGQFVIRQKFDFLDGRLSSDGTEFYGVSNKKIEFYSISSGNLLRTVKIKDRHAYEIQQLSEGKLLYKYRNSISQNSMSQNYSLMVNIINKDLSVAQHFEVGKACAISDNEQELISVSENGTIKIYSLKDGKILAEMKDTFILKEDINNPTRPGAKIIFYRISKINRGEFYLISYSTGIMSLVSSKEKKVVANIFTDKEDWAVIAKDGRMDGTSKAFDKLEWRDYDGENLIGNFSLSSTFEKYYTPRLLYTILTGDNSKLERSPSVNISNIPTLQAEKINNQPFLIQNGLSHFSSSNKNVPLEITVTSNSDKITRMRLYQNNKLIGEQKGNGGKTYQFNVSLNSIDGGKIPIYAIASTADGVDSEKCKLYVEYAGKDATKPKLYVVVVGINKYINPKYRLNYALTDATSIKKQFENSKSELFESIEVISLFDGEASKGKIMQAFSDLSKSIKEQDVFVFYYAGHGTMSDATKEFYIIPQDVTQLYGNQKLLNEKAISATELNQLSMRLNSQKQVFIIDACHSASALSSLVMRGAAEERAIGQLARSTGTFWLTATGSDQFAIEFEQLGHGVFTYSLLEVLEGKDIGTKADGNITVRELSSYVEQRVPELSQKYNGTVQYPASFSFGNDFPLIIFK